MVCPSCSTLSQAYWQARTIFHFQLVTNDRSRTIKLCKACSLEKWEIFWVFLEESPDKKDIPSMPCKSVRSEGSLRKNYNCDQLRRADSCNWASAIIILQIIETNIWQIWRCSTTTNTNLQIQTRSLKRGRRGAGTVTATRRELSLSRLWSNQSATINLPVRRLDSCLVNLQAHVSHHYCWYNAKSTLRQNAIVAMHLVPLTYLSTCRLECQSTGLRQSC